MINRLVRLFIQDCDNVTDPAVREKYGVLSGAVGIVLNLLLSAGKFFAGVVTGSIAITADAFNNLSDAGSSVVTLVGFKLAGQKADDGHPFGHGRAEYLAGLLVSLMILLVGLELGKTSIGKILRPEAVDFSLVSVAILAASILVKLWMAVFNTHIGKLIDSSTLQATAADSRNDVLSTGAVLLATLISRFTPLELDGWMGLAVAVFILYSGAGLIKETLDPLLGQAPDEALVHYIHDKVMSYPGVLGTHDLMVHDYGPGRQFASVHVEMAAEGDVMENHDVIDNIERDFWDNDHLHVVIHFDPIITSDEKVNDARHWLGELVRDIDPALTIHDLRMVAGPTHTNLIFDCVTPAGFEMDEADLKQAIKQAVRSRRPDYFCVITVESGYASIPH